MRFNAGVPVEFLTDEQAAGFGRFTECPSQAELERVFLLDDADRMEMGKRRGAQNRFGFALQLTTVRYLGTFLSDPLAVPTEVLDYLAEQLAIADASCVKAYVERVKTSYEHQWEVRQLDGYVEFGHPQQHERFQEFLAARAWMRVETAKALFDAAVAWLRQHRVLLPRVSVLARLVAEQRRQAQQQLHARLYQAAMAMDRKLPGRLPVRLEPDRDGRVRLRLHTLDKLDEPDSLVTLRQHIAAMLPPVDLPELLLEIHAHTGFLSEFTHASGSQARMSDAEISLAAVLVAEATNVGYAPAARENHTALSRSRLSHTEQNYLRAETLKASNARLIEAQANIGLAQAWGGGQVASVDGLRHPRHPRRILPTH